MSKLSDLFKSKDRTVDALTPSETAFHALNRDDDGLLTYTKVMWNSNGTIDMTDGSGFAYLGVEEFVEGVTTSGIIHNNVQEDISEVGEKDIVGGDIHLTVNHPQLANARFVVDGKIGGGLTFIRGAKYRIIVSDISTEGYTLYISTEAYGADYTKEYLGGVNNSRTCHGGPKVDPNANTDEPLEITVPNDAPDILYFASGNHANVYGIIIVKDKNEMTNLKHRKYEQVRFDNQKLTYFMNDEGFLIARYGQD
jgi:hypothetical protein